MSGAGWGALGELALGELPASGSAPAPITAAATFGTSRGVSQVQSALAGATALFAEALSTAHAATAGVVAAQGIARSAGITVNANGTLEASVTYPSNREILNSTGTAVLASMVAARADGLVLGSEIGLEGVVSLAVSKSQTQAPTTAALGSVAYTKNLSDNTAAIVTTASQFAAGRSAGIAQASGTDISAALSLAIRDGQSQSAAIGIAGVVSLGRANSEAHGEDAIYAASLDLSRSAVMALVNRAVTDAGLSLSAIKSVQFEGTTVLVGLVTPDGRTFTIEADVRLLAIEHEDRIYKVEN